MGSTVRTPEHEAMDRIEEAMNAKRDFLDLSHLGYLFLPPSIGDLQHLRYLDLSYNKMVSLPLEITNLHNLVFLNISDNQITTFPLEILKLVNLRALDISGNHLKDLPSDISNLKSLYILRAGYSASISFEQYLSILGEFSKYGLP